MNGPVAGRAPLIADVKRNSLEDGPGIRSVVFFKGCPLRCVFCQNPETQVAEAEIVFSRRECIGCGQCEEACPHGAVDPADPRRIRRERCVRCGACAQVCPGRGLRRIGTFFSPADLAELLLRDVPFYRHSGGGVTVSGGECTLYPDYLESLLGILKAHRVHIALQTCGFFEYEVFARQVLPRVDVVYFDIKVADPGAHRRHTGRDNRGILENFRRLVRDKGPAVHARIPLVPGITDGRENLTAIAAFVKEAGAGDVALLPYNPLGVGLADGLGRPRPAVPSSFMPPEDERAAHDRFRDLIREGAKNGAMR